MRCAHTFNGNANSSVAKQKNVPGIGRRKGLLEEIGWLLNDRCFILLKIERLEQLLES